MTAFQKVIKYLAIAFAIYLIIMIVGVIFSLFAVIIGLLGLSAGFIFLKNTNMDKKTAKK